VCPFVCSVAVTLTPKRAGSTGGTCDVAAPKLVRPSRREPVRAGRRTLEEDDEALDGADKAISIRSPASSDLTTVQRGRSRVVDSGGPDVKASNPPPGPVEPDREGDDGEFAASSRNFSRRRPRAAAPRRRHAGKRRGRRCSSLPSEERRIPLPRGRFGASALLPPPPLSNSSERARRQAGARAASENSRRRRTGRP
jgi:hypothetical protein